MTIKLGRRCTWEEIKIGEVYAIAWEEGVGICLKNDSTTIIEIADSSSLVFLDFWKNSMPYLREIIPFHKLPLSVQRLWRTDEK